MKEYVLGFLFSEDKTHVGLVLKDHPDWQKGKLNGIGGKIEPAETAHKAMIREFEEETGVHIEQWDLFAQMTFNNDVLGGTAVVHCYKAFSKSVYKLEQQESELVVAYSLGLIPFQERVDHLDILLSMALNPHLIYCNLILK
jgi:8-oxo-dGTP diphosphatase